MTTLTLLVVMAAVALALGRALRAVPVAIALGVGVVGSTVGLPLDAELVRSGLALSASFLLFHLGTELDSGRVGEQRGAAVGVGLSQIVVLALVGGAVAYTLELDFTRAAWLTCAVAASSTLVGVEVLRRRAHVYEPVGRFVIGVLLTQDAIVIIALTALFGVERGGAMGAAYSLGALAVVVVGALAVGRFIAPRLLTRGTPDEEQRLLVVLAILFATVGATALLDLPTPLGAFIAGAALARFPVADLVRAQLSSFADFFIGLFYVSLGASLTLPSSVAAASQIALLTGALIAAPILLTPLARRFGMTARASLEGVLLLAQCGELALVVGIIGVGAGAITEEDFGVLATIAALTLAFAPLLSSDRVVHRLLQLDRRTSKGEAPEGHVLIIGAGEQSRELARALHTKGDEVWVVDDDRVTLATLEAEGIRTELGDGSSPSLLERVGVTKARAIISTMRRPADQSRLARARGSAPLLARVFSDAEAASLRALGAEPISEAEAGAEAFLAWASENVSPPG